MDEGRHDYMPLSRTGDGVRFSDEIRREKPQQLGLKVRSSTQLS